LCCTVTSITQFYILSLHDALPISCLLLVFYHHLRLNRFYVFYFTDVLPKPPFPRSVSASSLTSSHSAHSCFAITICAIRSPRSIVNSRSDKFTKITPISPL